MLCYSSASNINKLQRVQNTLAKAVIIHQQVLFLSRGPALYQLHWLTIKQRINFKLSSISYRIL